MTAFNRANFVDNGMYVFYKDGIVTPWRFVARFKHNRRDKAGFIKFLINNVSVEQYFHELEVEGIAPATILERRGYLSATVARVLKGMGYPATKEGFDAYIQFTMDRAGPFPIAA